MKHIIISSMIALVSLMASAQNSGESRFAVKASAEIGLGNSLSVSSSVGSLDSKASSSNYGVDFGWTFWKKQKNSLELNVGVAYSPTSVKIDLESIDYDYQAPASADMDGDAYQRYYQLDNVHQKVTYNSFTIPVYLTYTYMCNSWFGLHADLGMRLGFKTGSKISEVSGGAYSYGIYPKYGDLIIDEPYLNDFGTTDLADARRVETACNGFSATILMGAGLEFRLSKHFAADLSVRYNPGLTNLFKEQYNGAKFTSESAPVSYTVAEGQQVKALTDYMRSSKLNQLSLRIGLIYRF